MMSGSEVVRNFYATYYEKIELHDAFPHAPQRSTKNDPRSLTFEELVQGIQAITEKLGPEDQQIIRLYSFEGLSLREVAEKLMTTEDVIRGRILDIKERLRQMLAGDSGDLR